MMDNDIALALRLADAAGAAIRPFFRARHSVETKPDATPVTEADRAAEAAIRALIETERPEDGIIGEEYGVTREGAGRRWVLDPIDGTRSFMTGRPIFGTLIALLEGETPVLGIIDQPIARERWIGVRGQPTLFNGQPARTRGCARLTDAQLGTTSPYLFDAATRPGFEAVASAAGNLVLGGDCYNYGLVALGQLDLVVESGLKLHDFAALVPVVEGAGGRMCDWRGEPLGASSDGRVIAVGDAALITEVIDLLN
jgi:histidinol phosphatase-like enzyme (inositol monophosphatase family)